MCIEQSGEISLMDPRGEEDAILVRSLSSRYFGGGRDGRGASFERGPFDLTAALKSGPVTTRRYRKTGYKFRSRSVSGNRAIAIFSSGRRRRRGGIRCVRTRRSRFNIRIIGNSRYAPIPTDRRPRESFKTRRNFKNNNKSNPGGGGVIFFHAAGSTGN